MEDYMSRALDKTLNSQSLRSLLLYIDRQIDIMLNDTTHINKIIMFKQIE